MRPSATYRTGLLSYVCRSVGAQEDGLASSEMEVTGPGNGRETAAQLFRAQTVLGNPARDDCFHLTFSGFRRRKLRSGFVGCSIALAD
jgi:ribosomal protein S11